MKKCSERNIAFIDMKPLAGGAIEDASLALRYIYSNPDVTIVIPGMYSIKEAYENIKAALDENPLTSEELSKIEEIRSQLGSNFCRRCNYCQPCSAGINISGVFLFAGYLQRYDLGNWGYDRYKSLSIKPDACVDCGLCEEICPYNLPIRQMLKDCKRDFDNFAIKKS